MGMYAIDIEAYPSRLVARMSPCTKRDGLFTQHIALSPYIFSYGVMFPRTFVVHELFSPHREMGRFCPQNLRWQQVGLMQHDTHAFEGPAVEQLDEARPRQYAAGRRRL